MIDRDKGSGRSHEWLGWRLYTHDGDELGTVVGIFVGGPHDGHLRVHQPIHEGNAVLAVPQRVVACAERTTLVLTAAATAPLEDWVVYLVRRYSKRTAPERLPDAKRAGKNVWRRGVSPHRTIRKSRPGEGDVAMDGA